MTLANNWPENLYLGDHASNAADSCGTGDGCGEITTHLRRSVDAQVREIRLALSRGERVGDLARVLWRAQEHGQQDQARRAAPVVLAVPSTSADLEGSDEI